MIWSIDGLEWTIPCAITRIAEIQASEISGLMMNGAYFNDVIGTYMRYEVAIAVPLGMRDQYYQIYDLLSAPMNYHTFVMPYNSDYCTFNGRVEELSDEWVYQGSDGNWWKGVRFTAVSSTPTQYVDDDNMKNEGLTPFPDSSEAQIGAIYELTAQGWEPADIEDADEEYF